MKRRVCLIIAALAAMSCGSSNSNEGNPSSNGGATGQQCVSPNCIACITQNCNSEAMTTFGGGYMNNQWNGGQCHNFMGCSNCGHQNETACAQQDGTGCVAALPAFISCVNSPSCNTACGNNSSGGGSCATISMGDTSGSWTLQIIAKDGTGDVSGCSSPGQTLTVVVSGGSFSVPTSAVTCGGATSSTFSGTISSSGTVTGVFGGYVPGGGSILDVCDIPACCSSPTSCAFASNTPGVCPGVILTKQ